MQTLKKEIKENIINSALTLFSKGGYQQTSVSAIAQRAGISTGNVYHYFKTKESLLEEIIPSSFTEQFKRYLTDRMASVKTIQNISLLDSEHPYFKTSREFMDFVLSNRERVIFLLKHSSGSSHEGFREELEDIMRRECRDHYEQMTGRPFSQNEEVIIHIIYSSYVENIADILNCPDRETIEKRIAGYARYHLSGLNALFKI